MYTYFIRTVQASNRCIIQDTEGLRDFDSIELASGYAAGEANNLATWWGDEGTAYPYENWTVNIMARVEGRVQYAGFFEVKEGIVCPIHLYSRPC